MEAQRTIRVTDAPFGALCDGVHNDRAAIQQAIDAVFAGGGGTVVLPGGRTCLSSGIVLKTGVTLFFEDGAVLQQIAGNEGFVKPQGDGYVPYRPMVGHNYSAEIKWSHCWYKNYPFLFAPEGSHDFAVKGRGVIRMSEAYDPEALVKLCPIGFYRCHHFEIADVHITNYHSYALMPFSCEYGLFRSLLIDNANHGNGDGICLMNCRHIRVTGCTMDTGDDAVYIFSSCRDPRKSEWWNSDTPQPSVDIEVDHNDLRTNHCKAFGLILWGLNCEDLEQVEVRDVYVHDNYFQTMGIWLYNPYTDRAGDPPVTGMRFENNRVDGIEINFFETAISDMNHYRSMRQFQNGDFDQGRCFWAMTKDPARVGVVRKQKDTPGFGYVRGGETRAAIWQGVYVEAGVPCLFRCEGAAAGEGFRLFVRDLDTGESIAALPFSNAEQKELLLHFTVPKSGNYRIGLESGAAKTGEARITNAVLGNNANAFGFEDVIFDRGKIIYTYQ